LDSAPRFLYFGYVLFIFNIIVILFESDVGGHPAPAGRALTNDLCGQYVKVKVKINVVFDFKVLTALKGWVGLALQGRGALHIIIIIYRHGALHIIILKLNDYTQGAVRGPR
jgi:hypothetical protein